MAPMTGLAKVNNTGTNTYTGVGGYLLKNRVPTSDISSMISDNSVTSPTNYMAGITPSKVGLANTDISAYTGDISTPFPSGDYTIQPDAVEPGMTTAEGVGLGLAGIGTIANIYGLSEQVADMRESRADAERKTQLLREARDETAGFKKGLGRAFG